MGKENSAIEKLLIEEFGDECEVNEADTSTCGFLKENLVKLKKIKPGTISLDMPDFQEGVNSMSMLCGQISALTSIGINPNKAMDYLVDKAAAMDMMMHNIKITEISSRAAVDAAKYESAQVKANSI